MKDKKIKDINTIEPYCVLRAVIRNILMIIMAGIIGFLMSTIVIELTFVPQYASHITFVVTARSGATTYYTDTSAASQAAATFSELLESSLMKKVVAEDLGVNKLTGTIAAEQVAETNLITVTATADNPKDAFLIIKAVEDNYAEVSDYISKATVLRILDNPKVPTVPVNMENTRRNTILFGVACALAMLATIIWMFIQRDTIQNREGAKAKLETKLMAVIPHENNLSGRSRDKKKLSESLLITAPTRSYGFCESVRMVSVRLENEKDKGNSVFMFTSISESEGKSTVSANTAISLCDRGYKVLLIDIDKRKPAQKKILLKENSIFTDFGAMFDDERYTPAEIVDQAFYIRQYGLFALLNNKPYITAIEKLASSRMAEIIRIAKEKYDFVIIDTPPMGYFADSEAMAEYADCSVLVVRQDVVPADDINDGVDTLQAGKAKLLGVVLNDVRYLMPTTSVYGYGYGYGKYGYGFGKKKNMSRYGYGYGNYTVSDDNK